MRKDAGQDALDSGLPITQRVAAAVGGGQHRVTSGRMGLAVEERDARATVGARRGMADGGRALPQAARLAALAQ